MYWEYVEEKGRVGISTPDVGTKTGNEEKTKASNYICGPVEKWHCLLTKELKKAMEDREI